MTFDLSRDFLPDWYSCPTETIYDCLEYLDMSGQIFKMKLDLSDEEYDLLMSDKLVIDERIGEKLFSVIGGSTQFWINRYANYVSDFERYKQKHNLT